MICNSLQAVGLAAKQGILRNASNTVCHVKQLLGRGLEEEAVQAAISAEPSKVKTDTFVTLNHLLISLSNS